MADILDFPVRLRSSTIGMTISPATSGDVLELEAGVVNESFEFVGEVARANIGDLLVAAVRIELACPNPRTSDLEAALEYLEQTVLYCNRLVTEHVGVGR